MKTTQVTSAFLLLLLLFIGTGYVSSGSVPGDQITQITPVPGDERYVQEAHLARYQEHLANLGIYRLICQ